MVRRGIASVVGVVAAMLCALLMTTPAAARSGQPLATCIVRATPAMTAAALFAQPTRFDCATPPTRYGAGDFWVMSAPLAATAAPSSPVIRIASLWQDRVTLYVLHADGHIVERSFTNADTARHLRLGALIETALPAAATPPVRLLWHVEGATNLRGVLNGPMLLDREAGRLDDILAAALYAGFVGLCLALFVYNLALWAALRQRFQVVYCLMLACLIGYAVSSSGAIELWTGMDNNTRLRLNAVLLASSAATALLFARSFFEQRVFAGWLRPGSAMVVAALGASVLGVAVVPPRWAWVTDDAINIAYLLLLLLVPAILWRAWRRKSDFMWLFLLGWGVPILVAGLRVAAAFNLLAWRYWLDNSTIVSMALEAGFSSLAIAYRIFLLSRERDEAREQEIEARLLADTDPLTGLLNLRAFLAQAIGRPGDQLLLIVDIDHFKRVNETIGHDGGDEVLRVVARALRAAVPVGGLVARIGGEEFAIVVDASRPMLAEAVLDQLRAERMPFDITVTASIGTCTGPLAREVDWKTLYRQADRALFAAKAAGRDRARDAAGLAAAA